MFLNLILVDINIVLIRYTFCFITSFSMDYLGMQVPSHQLYEGEGLMED